jgi:DNA end-binding protein Ku
MNEVLMRPMWSGAVSFGLIYIPVKMYKATEERHLDFHLYRKGDFCPVQYTRVCKATGEEIDFTDIVRGYEHTKGDVVILHDKDFAKAYSKRTETIEIMEFVDSSEIDSKYYEKPYYLEPEKGAGKVYSLLVEALRKSNKVGIARFVLRDLEHLGVLKEENGILIINQMRFFSEIRKPEELNIPATQKIAKQELDMATQLIDQLSQPFEPGKHKDTYSEVIKKAIKSKAGSSTSKVLETESGPAEVVDLLSKLRQSLKNAKDKENVS